MSSTIVSCPFNPQVFSHGCYLIGQICKEAFLKALSFLSNKMRPIFEKNTNLEEHRANENNLIGRDIVWMSNEKQSDIVWTEEESVMLPPNLINESDSIKNNMSERLNTLKHKKRIFKKRLR